MRMLNPASSSRHLAYRSTLPPLHERPMGVRASPDQGVSLSSPNRNQQSPSAGDVSGENEYMASSNRPRSPGPLQLDPDAPDSSPVHDEDAPRLLVPPPPTRQTEQETDSALNEGHGLMTSSYSGTDESTSTERSCKDGLDDTQNSVVAINAAVEPNSQSPEEDHKEGGNNNNDNNNCNDQNNGDKKNENVVIDISGLDNDPGAPAAPGEGSAAGDYGPSRREDEATSGRSVAATKGQEAPYSANAGGQDYMKSVNIDESKCAVNCQGINVTGEQHFLIADTLSDVLREMGSTDADVLRQAMTRGFIEQDSTKLTRTMKVPEEKKVDIFGVYKTIGGPLYKFLADRSLFDMTRIVGVAIILYVIIRIIVEIFYLKRDLELRVQPTNRMTVSSGSLWSLFSLGMIFICSAIHNFFNWYKGRYIPFLALIVFVNASISGCVLHFVDTLSSGTQYLMMVVPALGLLFRINYKVLYVVAGLNIFLGTIHYVFRFFDLHDDLLLVMEDRPLVSTLTFMMGSIAAIAVPHSIQIRLDLERAQVAHSRAFTCEVIEMISRLKFNEALEKLQAELDRQRADLGIRKDEEIAQQEGDMNPIGERERFESLGSTDPVLAMLIKMTQNIRYMSSYAPKNVGDDFEGSEEADEDAYRDDADYQEDEDVINGVHFMVPAPEPKEEEAARDDGGEGEHVAPPSDQEAAVLRSALLDEDSAGSFRKRRGTLMSINFGIVISSTDIANKMNSLLNRFVINTILAEAGFIEYMSVTTVVASFNCQMPCINHLMSACRAAMQIKNSLQGTHLRFWIAISSGFCYAGTCGNDLHRARVTAGEPMLLAVRIPALAKQHLRTQIIVAEETVLPAGFSAVAIDRVAFIMPTGNVKPVSLYELRTADLRVSPELSEQYRKAFCAMLSGKYGDASSEFKRYLGHVSDDTQAIRLQGLAERLAAMHREGGYLRVEVGFESFEPRGGSESPRKGSRDAGAEGGGRDQKKAGDAARGLEGEDADKATEPVVFPEAGAPGEVQFELGAPVGAPRNDPALDKFTQEEELVMVEEDTLFGMFMPKQDDDDDGLGGEDETAAPAEDTVARPHAAPVGEGPGRDALLGELPRSFVDANKTRWQRSDRIVGVGAFSTVYLALAEQGNLVAMKCFSLMSKNITRKEVRLELDTLSSLRNDYIVGYVSYSFTEHHFIILMEYVPGGSLYELLQQFGPLPAMAARRYMIDILKGLEYLHEHNTTHCDIKPHNVLLSNDGVCKLSDFGSAVNLSEPVRVVSDAASDEEKTVRGTTWYMAPETVRGVIDPANDIWSIGITLIEMLTGRQPWDYRGTQEAFIFELARNENMVPTVPPEITDPAAREFIQQCCVRDPTKRPTVSQLKCLPYLN